MTDKEQVTELPEDCLRQLALEGQPFTGDAPFYEDQDREIRLATVIDLLWAGSIVVLTGPTGVGKSACLRELPRRADNLSVTLIDGHSELRLADIIEALGVANDPDPPAAVRRMLQKASHQPLLAIDNAEALAPALVQRLAKLQAVLTSNDLRLPMVIACDEHAAADLVATFAGQTNQAVPIQQVALARFSRADTAAYVRVRLAQAGGDYSLLSDRQIERIYRRSAGLPRRIHQQAVRELRRTSGDRRALLPTLRLPALPPTRPQAAAAATASAIAVATLAGWWWTAGDPAARGERIAAHQPAASAGDVAASGENRGKGEATSSTKIETSPEKQETAAQTTTWADNDSDAGATSADGVEPPAWVTNPDIAPPKPDDAGSAAASEPKDSEANPSRQATTANGDRDRAQADSSEPKPASEAQREARDESPRTAGRTDVDLDQRWYRQRPGDNFTIQILGAREPTTVHRFLDQIPDPRRTRIVQTEREGATWYVVLTGDYAERSAAKEAIDGLPEPWREHGAFPRSFASLKGTD